MTYSYSQLDRNNLQWFMTVTSRQTLQSIRVLRGEIRGLRNLMIDFKYPITSIAGRNGSGKTTVLSLAACAFHNSTNGYRLPGRTRPYYTFSDFFIQSAEEIPPGGITISYQILSNRWRRSDRLPKGEGSALQYREKKREGRWNSYTYRMHRPIVFLGIDRVVPHSEKSVLKGHRRSFLPSSAKGWEGNVKEIVGRILDRDYSNFEYQRHSKYQLPIVTHRGRTYSGFNMGAGENTLFGIISTILDCPEGAMILIDEIELGLHEEAQGRLIRELKELCLKRQVQIICTTHSPIILDCLPPEGRIFLERIGNSTQVTPGISSAFATGKLAGKPKVELDILVEDSIAQLIVEAALPKELRLRVCIIPIGSSTAVIRHLAARFKEKRSTEVCALLDGDKSSIRETHLKHFLSALESWPDKESARNWANVRIDFLPGTKWPEAWILEQGCNQAYQYIAQEFGLSPEEVEDIYATAARDGKHNEFYTAAERLNLKEEIVAHKFVKAALLATPLESERICKFVRRHLG
ncbi:MAG TPA: AAA family ATPase [Blastocatellia bacterium]|nr:AAA family ATPase [Blastocatellia bacterium]